MKCDILGAIGSVTAECRCANCRKHGAAHLVDVPSGAATHSLYCRECCPVCSPPLGHLAGPMRETRGQQGSLFETSKEAL